MCGRFALAIPRRLVAEAFGLDDFPGTDNRFNIAPSQEVEAVVVDGTGHRVARSFRWGLVPSWAKDVRIGYKMINARSETVFDKPAFRVAIRHRRCLIPAQGFYEWQHVAGKKAAPYFITLSGSPVMALAGIHEHWAGPDGRIINSVSILTREAAGVVRLLHDRQPVILPAADFTAWLDPGLTDRPSIASLLQAPPPELTATPVGILVNSPKNDGWELVTAIGSPLDKE